MPAEHGDIVDAIDMNAAKFQRRGNDGRSEIDHLDRM